MKKEYNALHQRHTEVGASGPSAGATEALTAGAASYLRLLTFAHVC